MVGVEVGDDVGVGSDVAPGSAVAVGPVVAVVAVVAGPVVVGPVVADSVAVGALAGEPDGDGVAVARPGVATGSGPTVAFRAGSGVRRSTGDGGIAEGDCDPTPRHGYSGTCGGGGGCSAAPGARGDASWLLALAAFVIARRKR